MAIGAPSSRGWGVSGQDDQVALTACQPPQFHETLPALGLREEIVPVDEGDRPGEGAQGDFQHMVVALVGNQPEIGQGLALSHRAAIAARHG